MNYSIKLYLNGIHKRYMYTLFVFMYASLVIYNRRNDKEKETELLSKSVAWGGPVYDRRQVSLLGRVYTRNAVLRISAFFFILLV